MQFRLIILALGMFVIGTDGFVIAGLLPDIARATDVTTSSAGQLITIFALVYAIASPILASALGGVERKQLLLGSLAVFVLGNVLVAVSTLYPVLLAGRVIAALGASTFTPAALVITAALATPERRGRSIALVTSGLTIATIVGVPIGSFIGAVSGFQNVFWFIVAVGVVVLVLVAWRFPPVAAPVAVDLRQRLRTLRLPGVPATIIATFVVFLSAFTVYNYIAEFFAIRAGIEGSPLSWVLLAFGVGGAIGNILGGVRHALARRPHRVARRRDHAVLGHRGMATRPSAAASPRRRGARGRVRAHLPELLGNVPRDRGIGCGRRCAHQPRRRGATSRRRRAGRTRCGAARGIRIREPHSPC
jgi:MFS transporter, DHA1 family